MSKKLVLMAVLVMVMAGVSFGVNAYTGFNSNEDAPAYALGDLAGQGSAVGDWAGAWTDDSGGRDYTDNFKIVAGGAPEDPDQHLAMYDADSSNYLTNRAMDAWSGDFVYSFTHRWNNDALAATYQHQFKNASGLRPLNIKWEASGAFRVNDVFLIMWHDEARTEFKSAVGTDWVSVAVVCDWDTATFDLYWEQTDGTMGLAGSMTGWKDSAYSGDVVKYELYAPKMNTTNGSGMDIDAIAVTVPEPMTMTLLGLGGLALIRRKR